MQHHAVWRIYFTVRLPLGAQGRRRRAVILASCDRGAQPLRALYSGSPSARPHFRLPRITFIRSNRLRSLKLHCRRFY